MPDLVLRVGDMPTSKPLRAWLAGAPQVLLDPHAAWHEPTRAAELILHGAAAPACDALAAALEMLSAGARHPGLACGLERRGRRGGPALAAAPDAFEPAGLGGRCRGRLADDAIVWLSSSMPVRDVEACFPPPSRCASSPTAARTASTASCPLPRGRRGQPGRPSRS